MKNILKNNKLILYFGGDINSSNVAKVEEEANKELEGKTFTSLELDFEEVKYISSAGLRMILKLKQKYGDVAVTNVTLEVYDVFQMTGFTDILTVNKALRKIDISKATLIGEGYFSLVYRIDKDTIIKVYKNSSHPDDIKRELNLAKQAFVLGIPTAISFDIVRVGDKLGVVFEMLDSVSLRDLFRDYPDRYKELIVKYTDLLKKINSTEPTDNSLPNTKDLWLEKVEVCKPYLTKEQYQKCHDLIMTIPEKNTFVHGDCHFKNIMTQGDELFLIDMDTLSKGHHIFELAAIYAPYIAFEEDDPGNNERFLGVPSELVHKIYDDVLEHYFSKLTEEIKIKIKIVAYIHMIYWNRVNEPNNNVRLEGCKGRLIPLLDQVKDLVIE